MEPEAHERAVENRFRSFFSKNHENHRFPLLFLDFVFLIIKGPVIIPKVPILYHFPLWDSLNPAADSPEAPFTYVRIKKSITILLHYLLI